MLVIPISLSTAHAQDLGISNMFPPMEIKVIAPSTNPPGVGGVLVKLGIPIILKINSTSQSSPQPSSERISWFSRQMKQDGGFTDWRLLSNASHGMECIFTPIGGGIFQILATLTKNGQAVEIPYLRKQDAFDCIDGDGHCSVVGKRGSPEFIGVTETDQQIAFRNKAHEQIGTTNYSKGASLTVPTSSLLGSYTIPSGHDKCNAFVYVMANSAESPVPLTRRNKLFLIVNPPLAYDWYDGTYSITGWKVIAPKDYPQPGFVVARPDASVWNKNDPMYGCNHGQRYAHVGILDYDGSWIQADEKMVDEYPSLTDPKYQPIGMRRYTGNK